MAFWGQTKAGQKGAAAGMPDGLNWLCYFAGNSKSHHENSISFIFLESPHQVDMKNVVKSSKHFFGYFNTLESHSAHRGAFCQFPFRCIYYFFISESTGKETGKTHLTAVRWLIGNDIGPGPVTSCCLWSLGNHRQHTSDYWAALRRLSENQNKQNRCHHPAYFRG